MPTVQAYLSDLLESEELRPATRRAYNSNLKCHVFPGLGSIEVTDVTPAILRGFFGNLRRTGVGPGALGLSYRLLSKMLRTAQADDLIQRNPLDSIRTPKQKRNREDPPARADVDEIERHISPHYRALVHLLAYGGLRIGEAGGLRVEDWSPERRLLQVRRQQTRNGVSDLKTDAGRRKIFLTKELAETLNQHLAKYPPVSGRIFSSRTGGPVYADIFYPVFRTACKRAGVRKYHPHELRHHAVSAMLSAGIPPRTVQAVVGHESPTMTLGVYGHVSEADLEAAAMQLEQDAS